MRTKLLVVFVVMAGIDTAGKIVERDAALVERVLVAENAVGLHFPLRDQRRTNNFDIFRGSSRHLADEKDLYAEYPREQRDRFKYSPAFAFLFTPLAVLPWGLSLLMWHLINALALFYALTRVLKGRAADFAIAAVLLEVWRSMQNAQSNALVAASIVLAFVAIEQQRHARAASWISLGAVIKVFPLAALVFAAPTRARWRVLALTAAMLLATLALPLLVTPSHRLGEQYASWIQLERADSDAKMQSFMGLLHFVPGFALPNFALQLLGLGLLVLPLVLRPERWSNDRFRLNMLSATLLFVVLFNPQAERASYVIAFTGIAIWYASAQRTYREHALFAFAVLAIPVVSLFVPGKWLRTPEMTVIRLVVPCVLIWARIQAEMLSATDLIRITRSEGERLATDSA